MQTSFKGLVWKPGGIGIQIFPTSKNPFGNVLIVTNLAERGLGLLLPRDALANLKILILHQET
jgi:hypothetical protein